jgi:hypothetical protein
MRTAAAMAAGPGGLLPSLADSHPVTAAMRPAASADAGRSPASRAMAAGSPGLTAAVVRAGFHPAVSAVEAEPAQVLALAVEIEEIVEVLARGFTAGHLLRGERAPGHGAIRS